MNKQQEVKKIGKNEECCHSSLSGILLRSLGELMTYEKKDSEQVRMT
jgi:hypothetical protein